MKKEIKLALSILAIFALSISLISSLALASEENNGNENGNGDEKVILCHATGSATNPFEVLELSEEGAEGHEEHANDIIPITDRDASGTIDEADCVFGSGGQGGGPGGEGTTPPTNQVAAVPAPARTVVQTPTTVQAPLEGFGGGPALPSTGVSIPILFGLPALVTALKIAKDKK